MVRIIRELTANNLSQKKREEMERQAKKIAEKTKKRAAHPRASFRGKLFFNIFRKMQMAPDASWNPKDGDWWVNQGWTKDGRPWKK